VAEQEPADREPADQKSTNEGPPEQPPADRKKSVAVLAFENMSPDAENEYFADGISEEILNVLADLPELRVIARTSAFSFKGSEATVAEIADKLDVAYVLEGSVRKAGDRVRVTAQLIETDSESHLWSETYDRELVDIFAVQDEIARAIAGELELQLTPDQEQRLATALTDNVDAYNQYLLGRQLWHTRNLQTLRASAEALEEAVTLDPEFAEAWAALADALVLLPEYDPSRSIATIAAARDAVNRALELKPALPQALTTRAYLRFMYDYDWTNAERDFQRAMALDPAYPTAQQWYGEFLAVQYRDIDGALRQFRKASELDPLAPIMWHVSGWFAQGAGRVEEAISYYQRALEINPNLQSSYGNLSAAYAGLGRYDEARRAAKRFRELMDLPPAEPPTWIDAMEDPVAKAEYVETLDRSEGQYKGVAGRALEYMVLGQEEKALENLVLGFEDGDPYAVHVNRLVVFDPLRDDPRFQAHLAKMNLWPPPER
jgi:TolB-like protein/Tfp pilus assembly protein PilF